MSTIIINDMIVNIDPDESQVKTHAVLAHLSEKDRKKVYAMPYGKFWAMVYAIERQLKAQRKVIELQIRKEQKEIKKAQKKLEKEKAKKSRKKSKGGCMMLGFWAALAIFLIYQNLKWMIKHPFVAFLVLVIIWSIYGNH